MKNTFKVFPSSDGNIFSHSKMVSRPLPD